MRYQFMSKSPILKAPANGKDASKFHEIEFFSKSLVACNIIDVKLIA